MKIVIFLTVACLLAGANAQDTNFLETLKNALKTTVDHVKENGQNVLTGLAGQLQQAGGQLLQSTLLKLLEGLGTQGVGKRDIEALQKVREMFAKFQEKMNAHKARAGKVMNKALEKLKAVMENLGNLSFLKKPLAETHKKVDEATQSYVDVHTRFLDDLKNTLTGLGSQLVDQGTKLLSETLQQLLLQGLGGLTGAGKRDLHPAIQSLVDFFKPHVQSVLGTATEVGSTVKGHVTNLWQTVQQHAGQLSTKLQGHVDELKQHGQTLLGHGKNAVNALKAAVTDVLTQTLTNAKGTVTDAGKTLSGASKLVTDHLTNALNNAAGSQ